MSTPIFDPEDPQLTAYALGELTDPAERAEVATLLQNSPEARLAMKEIQDTTATLTAEYDHERRSAEEPAGSPPPNVVRLADHVPARRPYWSRPWLAAAAVLFLSSIWASVFSLNRSNRQGAVLSVQSGLQTGASSSRSNNEVAAVPMPELVPTKEDPAKPLDQSGGLRNGQAQTAPADATAANAKDDAARVSGSTATASLPSAKQGEAQGNAGAAGSVASRNASPASGPSGSIAQSSALPGGSGGAPVGFDGFINYGSPVATGTAGAARLAQPTAAAPMAPPRVAASDTNFYRAQAGLAASAKPPAEVAFDKKTLAAARAKANSPEARAHLLAKVDADGEKPVPERMPQITQADGATRRQVPLSSPEATYQTFNTAAYDPLVENPFLAAQENPLSTFSIDVDTASYANVRRFIDGGSLPPPDAVRLEELLNYFPYDYAPPGPESDKPFALHLEAAACPWAPEHRLVRIGLKGKEIAVDKRPASNLVFLLDVSGSMDSPERLPLVKAAMLLLVAQLDASDHVAIVTYAGNSGLVLSSTAGDHKETILAALNRLEAGGSTNGASGISLAYKVAKENFIKGGTNRVILATDGDFNVGVTSQGDLVRLIQEEAKGGVFLSALGVGTDNFKDSTMQKLADKGNGNYHYIDRLDEARKVLVEQMSGTLLTIAKDVKIQVEFNPSEVASYRLIGYEKRMLRKEDFNDDKIDAGEIGAGHSVTALYEVVPVGQGTSGAAPTVDALKYGPSPAPAVKEERMAWEMSSHELLTLKMRYKAPDADTSERSAEEVLVDKGAQGDYAKASPDFKFAAGVAAFGLSLRDSPYKGSATLGAAVELAQEGKGSDPKSYRAGFIELARRAQALRDAR